ncbi:sigma-54 dependent transcriptional regulator [Microbulbifer sp. VAAF005]|uniref:sigma-54-dependent transcriptional regulator n=1 Tax=Microbulbifer sp. VAAF005 TaxID=3034230 RepID=UPI0024ADD755|nr:sigma-54 dependent transcriptional regulator [Microbulbifer sp. VAAF005]WHI48797.1 sigma-54 dependent transcriptional regulator [Microbulbifer sp. VAAF005]
MRPLALVVDDEPDICNLLSLTLQRMDVDCHTAATLSEAKSALDRNTYNFCLTDLRLPDGDGLQLVEYIQGCTEIELPIAVITAHGNMDTAIKALKLGAFDFVSKPVDLDRLRNLAQLALRLDSNQAPQQSNPQKDLILGEADNIHKLRQQISKVARSDAPVYISGESGAGKELAARSIHLQSARAEQPFIAINCGAIPSELMESEFFGHQKGSFTGAHKDHKGLLQSAEGGTLFLDEVADLPLEMQVKLLRAIQEKSIRPIGSNKEISIDTRILSATHKDLSEEVIGGRFRNDLYYRINVIEITVPPLRDRAEDIPLLTDVIMQRIASSAGLTPPALSHEAIIALQNYSFPGNVRQLENILERAFTLSDQNIIREEDLLLECNNRQENSLDKKQSVALPQTEKAASTENFNANKSDSLDEFLQRIEKEVIEETLVKTRWNRTAAAQKLGISFRSLRYRLKKLGLEN